MFQGYGVVLAFFVVAFIFALVVTTIPKLLAPRTLDPRREEIYECGERPIVDAWTQIPIRYYVVALIFLAFDVEVIFLAPWVYAFSKLPDMGRWLEGLIFFGILFLALLYAIRERAFRW